MRAAFVAALDELAIAVGRPRRIVARGPREPQPLTNAHARFVIAIGLARLGAAEHARALAREAQAALSGLHEEPVHAYLVAAFGTRLEQALAGEPYDQRLPAAQIAQLEALGRVERYKVDRLREISPTLAGDIPPGHGKPAIDVWMRHEHPQRDQAQSEIRDGLRAIAPTRRRAEHLAARFATGPEELQHACLAALIELPPEEAVPILAGIVAAVPPSIQASTLALRAVARFGYGELAPALVHVVRAALPRVGEPDLDRFVPSILHALRRLALHDDHAAIAAMPGDGRSRELRLVLAGARALATGAKRVPLFDDAQAHVATRAISFGADDGFEGFRSTCELVRALSAGLAQAPVELALPHVTRLTGRLVETRDTFGTNTHFCLSVLHVVESLVLATTDLAQAVANPLDPADQALLSAKHALA